MAWFQVNPQTTLLCQMLGLTDPFAVFTGQSSADNPDEIDIDDCSDEDTDGKADETKVDVPASNVGEEFPTLLHSQTANESALDDKTTPPLDSAGDETKDIELTTPASTISTGDARKRVSPDEGSQSNVTYHTNHTTIL